LPHPSLRRRGSSRNSRGVSSIIATVFMVVIILFISFNVFTFTLFKNTQFREAVNEINETDIEQGSERITFSDVNYTAGEGQVDVVAQFRNDGPVSIELITLWVAHAVTGKYGCASDLNIDLPVGADMYLERTVEIEGLNSSFQGFVAWFVTARGNRIPLEDRLIYAEYAKYSFYAEYADLAKGIGYMGMDFDSFRYYRYENPTKLLNYPDGISGSNVPTQTEAAFAINLTNYDPKGRNITIDSHSLWWSIIPTSDVPHNIWWYIVNVEPDGTIGSTSPGTFSNITIPYGESELLIFASADDVEAGFLQQKTPKDTCTVPVFLLLHGTVGDKPYSQTLPFVAVYFFGS